MNLFTVKLSVIIPTMGRSILIQTLESLLETGFQEMEILICGKVLDSVTNKKFQDLLERNKCLKHFPVEYKTGDSSRKKNYGVTRSNSQIIAFLDDDVRVAKKWPELMVNVFNDPSVGLVSGPSLVPDDINFIARMAGLALSSEATGYVAERYLKNGNLPRKVNWDRIIGCNVAYRKNVFTAIGGFPPEFYPGEEMIAAFKAEREENAVLLFLPEAYVYHYPRQSLKRFCRQIWTYGATRIRLIRCGIDFSLLNLIPGIIVAVAFLLLISSFFSTITLIVLLFSVFLYCAIVLYFSFSVAIRTNKLINISVFWMIILMHICYGLAEWFEFINPDKDWSEGKS